MHLSLKYHKPQPVPHLPQRHPNSSVRQQQQTENKKWTKNLRIKQKQKSQNMKKTKKKVLINTAANRKIINYKIKKLKIKRRHKYYNMKASKGKKNPRIKISTLANKKIHH